jgi:hypothetical protein
MHKIKDVTQRNLLRSKIPIMMSMLSYILKTTRVSKKLQILVIETQLIGY